MEIIFDNDICINSGKVIGLIDKNNYFLSYLKEIGFDKNNILIDGKKISDKELFKFKNTISIVNHYIENDYLNLTVYQYMKYEILNSHLKLRDYSKKIKDSLRIIGFSESYLEKKISLLSTTEQLYILFAIALLSNPNIIVLDNFFNSMDNKNKKRIIRKLKQLTEQYDKTFIMLSNKVIDIYNICDDVIVLSSDNVLISGSNSFVFEDNINKLIENNFDVPEICMFSHKVNEKKIKLGYFKDIRDLIKDIYKKV